MRLRLFGLFFPIHQNIPGQPGGEMDLPVGAPHLNIKKLVGQVGFVGDKWYADLELIAGISNTQIEIIITDVLLTPASGAPDLLIPADDPISDNAGFNFRIFNGSDPGSPWCISLGALRLVGDPPEKAFFNRDGKLVASFTSIPLFSAPRPNLIPLDVRGSSGGFELDLSAGHLIPTRAAFSANVRVAAIAVNEPNTQSDLFSWRGFSKHGRPILLHEANARYNCVFSPADPSSVFILNADNRASGAVSIFNPIQVPLTAQFCELFVEMRKGTGAIPKLAELRLQPRPGEELVLNTFAFADALNAVMKWRSNSELPLAMRRGDQQRPGSLCLAPNIQLNDIRPCKQDRLDKNGLHGVIGRTRFKSRVGGVFATAEIGIKPIPPANVSADLMVDTVLPIIEFTAESDTDLEIVTACPGETFTGVDSTQAANLVMHGPKLVLPLIDRRHVTEAKQAKWDKAVGDTEASTLSKIKHIHNKDAKHDTGVGELPTLLDQEIVQRFKYLFQSAKDAGVVSESRYFPTTGVDAEEGDSLSTPRFEPYDTVYGYGHFNLKLNIKTEELDYVIIRPDHLIDNIFNTKDFQDFKVDPSNNFMLTGDLPNRPDQQVNGDANLPVAIVKLSRDETLESIFDRHGLRKAYVVPGGSGEQRELFGDLLNRELTDKTWAGLIIFRVPIVGTQGNTSGLAGDLISNVKKVNLELAYLAVSPKQARNNGPVLQSHFARVLWKNGSVPIDPLDYSDDSETHETRFQIREIDVSWADNQLENLRVQTKLWVDSIFGIRFQKVTGDPREKAIDIIGRYDELTDEIRFLAQFAGPYKLFPFTDTPVTEGPLERVDLKSVEIIKSGEDLQLSLDGDIRLREFKIPGLDFDGFELDTNKVLEFKSFGLKIPKRLKLEGDLLEFSYPSLKFNLDLNPFRIAGISLKLKSIAMSFDGNGIDWESPMKLPTAKPIDITLPTLFIDLRLDFGLLPELASKNSNRFLLDFQIGFQGVSGDFWSRVQIGLSAVEFNRFELDLMRFLTVSVKKLGLVSRTLVLPGETIRYTAIEGVDVRLLVLDKEVVKHLSFAVILTQGGKLAFYVYLPTRVSGFLSIRWIMIGRGVTLSPQLAEDIMSVEVLGPGEDEKIAELLYDKNNPNEAPYEKVIPTSLDPIIGEWVFAAGFGIGGSDDNLLDGRLLFQDRKYYGLALGNGIFKEWFGFDFALSVLYEKGPMASQDRVVISIRAPKVVLPAFTFMGGVISLSISFDSSFLLDCGFPWIRNGFRMWDRTFGAIVTPFQATGGFYIRKGNISFPIRLGSGPGARSILAVGGGYGLQGGLGASFGGGVFTVWVTIGLYTIIEGIVVLEGSNMLALRLSGAIGVVLRGGGELRWWIISLRVEIVVGAEASITFISVRDPALLPHLSRVGIPNDQSFIMASTIRVRFRVYARASARACIGKKWFKICKSISVSVPMQVHYDLKLGGAL
ncbi:MAG: hypothetical protein ABIL58_12865 [Pseudomonadota bacterium]